MSVREVMVTIVLVATTLATLLLVVADGAGALSVGLGLGVALFVPGWAVLRLLRLEADGLTRVGLAVAISTAIDIAIVLPMFYLGIWSIELAITVLTLLILGLVAIDIPFIRRGLSELARGAIAGYPMVDFKVELIDGKFHAVDSDDLSFQMAGRKAFRTAIERVKPVLLEPFPEITRLAAE